MSGIIDDALDMIQFGGEEFSTGKYDVVRPDYASATSAETAVISKRVGRIEPLSTSYQQPRIPGIDNYGAYLNRRGVQSGDVIIPNPASNTIPIITVFALAQNSELVAFRSHRLGSLRTSVEKTVYDNVRFDFAKVMSPKDPLNPEFEGDPEWQQKRAVMMLRQDVRIGWRLCTTIDGVLRKFLIRSIDATGPVMDLLLEEHG